jgi:penicillin-binding protein 1C
MSLNVPAVALLDGVGANRFAARLAQAGARLVLPKGETPGLAMALGGVGVTLTDLTMLYAGIARGGAAVSLIERQGQDNGPPQRLIEPAAAWTVGNVLIGTPPPDHGAGGRIAYKTGTSYGYRDAWSVGFDGKRTIGVWVGRPDGAPVPGLIGRIAAAPILFDAFARGQPPAALPPAPNGVLVATNAKLPPPLQRYRPAQFSGAVAAPALRILYPPDGSRIELGSTDGKLDPVAVKVTGGAGRLTVLANGVPVQSGRSRTMMVDADGPGFLRLTVMDGRGATDSVLVRLQ